MGKVHNFQWHHEDPRTCLAKSIWNIPPVHCRMCLDRSRCIWHCRLETTIQWGIHGTWSCRANLERIRRYRFGTLTIPCCLPSLNICPGNNRCTRQHWTHLWRTNRYPTGMLCKKHPTFEAFDHRICPLDKHHRLNCRH